MNTVIGYRLGDRYALEPWQEGQTEARPVLLGLAGGVRVAGSGGGRLLVYQDPDPEGRPLPAAMALGWCWEIRVPLL